MTWYRSTTGGRLRHEPLSDSLEEYQYRAYHSLTQSVMLTNCSLNIYRDVYSIVIHNFTKEKNGYYWCQLAINNTNTQPSYRAWLYSDQTCDNSIYPYFRLGSLNEIQCAQYVSKTFPEPLTTPTSVTTLSISSRIIGTTLSSNESLIRVLGSFSTLLLVALLGVLALATSFVFYVHHLRKRPVSCIP